MVTYGRWEINSGGTWSQPEVGSPDPFNDELNNIASWTSVSVYAPGLDGDIFVIGSLFRNSSEFNIWRYVVATNTWSYVINGIEGSDVYGITAAYGFGKVWIEFDNWSVDDRPFITFGIIGADGSVASYYMFYYQDGNPTISHPELLCPAIMPMIVWDGQKQWLFGTSPGVEDWEFPKMYYRDCSFGDSWNEWVGWAPGSPGTDYPFAVNNALFTYIEDPGPRLLLSHGAKTSGGAILRKTWIFDGVLWTDVTPLGDDYTEPSARKEVGFAANGSKIWMIGGYGWEDDNPEPIQTYLSSIFTWSNSETRWVRESDFEFGADYNMRCCGKMDSGVGISLVPIG